MAQAPPKASTTSSLRELKEGEPKSWLRTVTCRIRNSFWETKQPIGLRPRRVQTAWPDCHKIASMTSFVPSISPLDHWPCLVWWFSCLRGAVSLSTSPTRPKPWHRTWAKQVGGPKQRKDDDGECFEERKPEHRRGTPLALFNLPWVLPRSPE